MGRRDRERIERIKRGEEPSIAAMKALGNPLGRTAVKLLARDKVVGELTKADLPDQIGVLSTTARTPNGASKVARGILDKTPSEMDKAIRKFRAEGKPVTVETLCAEVKENMTFLSLCESLGISYSWFEDQARAAMTRFGIEVKE